MASNVQWSNFAADSTYRQDEGGPPFSSLGAECFRGQSIWTDEQFMFPYYAQLPTSSPQVPNFYSCRLQSTNFINPTLLSAPPLVTDPSFSVPTGQHAWYPLPATNSLYGSSHAETHVPDTAITASTNELQLPAWDNSTNGSSSPSSNSTSASYVPLSLCLLIGRGLMLFKTTRRGTFLSSLRPSEDCPQRSSASCCRET